MRIKLSGFKWGVAALSQTEAAELARRVFRAVRRISPRLQECQADDVSQNVLVRFLAAIGGRKHLKHFTQHYLNNAVRAAAADEVRHLVSRKEAPFGALEPIDIASGKSSNPEDAAAAAETGQRIEACLLHLKPDRRAAVSLHLQGYGLSETALRLGICEKKAENLIYRGLRDLRRKLRASGLPR